MGMAAPSVRAEAMAAAVVLAVRVGEAARVVASAAQEVLAVQGREAEVKKSLRIESSARYQCSN